MTVKQVDFIFFWRADSISNFKAVYGRKPRKAGGEAGSYTKDFLQPRSELADALNRAFGVAKGSDTAVEWRWPGGSFSGGRYKPAADFASPGGRMNLRWETDSAPPPWRLHPSPTATTLETMQGTPDLSSESAADAQRQAIEDSGEHPWLVAVHCVGEGAVLYARLVLEFPGAGREYAGWSTLPKAVQDAMSDLPANKPGGYIELTPGADVRVDNKLAQRILEAFDDSPNVLLVGPPGTGKTVAMNIVTSLYSASDAPTVNFDDEALHGGFSSMPSNRRSLSLLFHPSYAYEHFVMGLLPDATAEGQVTVRPHVGPLLELAEFAGHPDSAALLVLDEFNRGNAAAIFGDTLGLLDADKRDTAQVATPFAHMNPKTDGGIALGATTTLPKSLRILAAMNSADRSVAPLDAAMRRRFAIVTVEPDLDSLATHIGAERSGGYQATDPKTWTKPEHVAALAVDLLTALNTRIEFVLGRDFLLGQSVFWDVGGATPEEALSSLAAAIDNRVIGTLALTFTDQDDELAVVLNVLDRPRSAGVGTWEDPSGAVQRFPRRLRLNRLSVMAQPDIGVALVGLLDGGPEAPVAVEDADDGTDLDE